MNGSMMPNTADAESKFDDIHSRIQAKLDEVHADLKQLATGSRMLCRWFFQIRAIHEDCHRLRDKRGAELAQTLPSHHAARIYCFRRVFRISPGGASWP